MKIEGFLEDIIYQVECFQRMSSVNSLKSIEIIKSQQQKIEQLEADKLELSKAIDDNCMSEYYGSDYCVHCDREGYNNHSKDCIVNKAQKYIEEVEK